MLKEIIESCKYVVKKSENVKISEIKLNDFIDEMKNIECKHWLSSSPFGLLELPVETNINFLLIYESIDFSFWGDPKWKIDIENKKEDGSIALLYVLLKYVKDRNITDFSNIQIKEFKEILKGNVEIPLFKERYNIITNVSRIVNEKMNGNFYKNIKNINNDIELFNLIIKTFPQFKDERTYKGKTIYFYKLAQLLTSDILHIREMKEKIQVNYSHLLGCADYKIPQVMRGLGILEYNNSLSYKVDNKIEIEQNSEEEIEIRASMLVVIDMIRNKLKGNICSMDINDYIWGQGKNIKMMLKPYHLTRCVDY